MEEYDSAKDSVASYYAAVEAKRVAGWDAVKRDVTIGDCRLLLGDCAKIAPLLQPVDAIIADPPYLLSSTSPGTNHCFGKSLKKFDSSDYKDIVEGFDYETLFPELEKICRPFNLFCFCSNKQISQIMSYHESRSRVTTLLVWHKTNAAPFANGVWRGDIEYCVHARDNGAVFLGNAEEKKKVSEHPIVVDASHPTVKPLSIIQKYVRICSNPGQTILDPFMGSGTTGAACVKLGRKFVGIEISEDHFETAVKRITDAYNRPDMFIETARVPEPVQEAML